MLIHTPRSMLRKLPKKHSAVKSKKGNVIATLISSDNENGAKEDGAEVEAIEDTTIMTDARLESQDLHPQDDAAHLPGGKLIPTYLRGAAAVDRTICGGDLLPENGHHHSLDLDPRLRLVAADMAPSPQNNDVGDLPRVGLTFNHDGITGEIDSEEQLGAVIALDPSHLHIHRAHVPPEEAARDALPQFYLAATHHLPELGHTVEDANHHPPGALALDRQAETEELLVDLEDHLPMTLMREGLAHALIIERDVEIIMSGIAPEA